MGIFDVRSMRRQIQMSISMKWYSTSESAMSRLSACAIDGRRVASKGNVIGSVVASGDRGGDTGGVLAIVLLGSISSSYTGVISSVAAVSSLVQNTWNASVSKVTIRWSGTTWTLSSRLTMITAFSSFLSSVRTAMIRGHSIVPLDRHMLRGIIRRFPCPGQRSASKKQRSRMGLSRPLFNRFRIAPNCLACCSSSFISIPFFAYV